MTVLHGLSEDVASMSHVKQIHHELSITPNIKHGSYAVMHANNNYTKDTGQVLQTAITVVAIPVAGILTFALVLLGVLVFAMFLLRARNLELRRRIMRCEGQVIDVEKPDEINISTVCDGHMIPHWHPPTPPKGHSPLGERRYADFTDDIISYYGSFDGPLYENHSNNCISRNYIAPSNTDPMEHQISEKQTLHNSNINLKMDQCNIDITPSCSESQAKIPENRKSNQNAISKCIFKAIHVTGIEDKLRKKRKTCHQNCKQSSDHLTKEHMGHTSEEDEGVYESIDLTSVNAKTDLKPAIKPKPVHLTSSKSLDQSKSSIKNNFSSTNQNNDRNAEDKVTEIYSITRRKPCDDNCNI